MNSSVFIAIIIGFAVFFAIAGISKPILWVGIVGVAGLIFLMNYLPILVGMVFALTFWLPTATIYVFNPRMYLLGIAGILLVYDYVRHPYLNRKEKILFGWVLIMIIVFMLVNFYTRRIVTGYVFSMFRGILKAYISGPILALFVYRKLRTKQELTLMFKIVAWSFAVPAVVSILQYLGVDWAWQLPLKVAHLSTKPVVVLPNFFAHSRARGFHMIPIAFTFQAVIGVSISTVLAIFMVQNPVRRLIYDLLAILATIGSLVTLTRSLLLGILSMDVYIVYQVLSRKSSSNIFLMRAISVTLFVVVMSVGGYNILNRETSGSRLTDFHDKFRPQLWKAGLILAMEHPFGIGSAQTIEVIEKERLNFIGRVDMDIATKFTSHNYLLNQLVYYGIPGFLLTLFILIWPFLLVRGRPMEGFEWMKYTVWSVLGVLYINSFFHNGGLTGLPLAWSAIGIAMIYDDHRYKAEAGDISSAVIEPPA